ncbi:MAG: arsenosugar biosynthesis radical SAM protein ArsS [Planctomycetia bacterium]|nr:arsenosugar biosynthesis radical SAM protein ArsS [Planctomycetia bacterium]
MADLTLLRQGSPLADARQQRAILEGSDGQAPFAQTLAEHGVGSLRANGIQVLQVNLGKVCNQTCRHCHVDAGPDRREVMSFETVEACLDVLARTAIPTLDITGGAPEMNLHFEHLVAATRRLGRSVIDRCNLTILVAPGYDHLPAFLAAHGVRVIASLPCYLERNTDAQRGEGVFERSIEALRRLNSVRYGDPAGGLVVDLVFNPQGPSLPPPQAELEQAYRRELLSRFGIVFNRLYTITNMPISRFLDDLLRAGRFDEYMSKLAAAFNPATCAGLMCRTTLSVDWRGNLYDCDFNQMLDLRTSEGVPQHISEFLESPLAQRPIVTGQHCYACTAGAGSSCQGAIS